MKDLTFLFGIVVLSLLAITIDFFNARRKSYKEYMSERSKTVFKGHRNPPPPPPKRRSRPVISPMKCVGRKPCFYSALYGLTYCRIYQVEHLFDELGEMYYRLTNDEGKRIMFYDVDGLFVYVIDNDSTEKFKEIILNALNKK